MANYSEQQLALFEDRYSLRDKQNNPVETAPEEMWDRVASAIADDNQEATEFYDLLTDFKFVPGGRILAGAGAEREKTFYNCYVIPVETKARRLNRREEGKFEQIDRFDAGSDSREAIFDTIATMVDIMSRGGGVGINWSVLRPSGAYLTRVSGTSSGPVGWMDVASKAVGEVEQGGSRRGAAMFMLNDWHPDVLKFIEAKKKKGRIENANISVAVSDDLMAAVENDEGWNLRFPDTQDPDYNVSWDGDLHGWIASGHRVINYANVPARELWSAITSSAHESGEPGVVFLDRYNTQSTGNSVERLISVNPCGEQGLGAYSVCNLGAMNLYAYVEGNTFNFRSFRFDVQRAIRFLDNAIDKNFYFLPETGEQQRRLRRIGLGIMGLADALVRLGIRYGSKESVKFVENVFQEMKDAAIWSSMEIAEKKGAADAWDDSMWERPYLREYRSRYAIPVSELRPLRNIFLLTVAPTGTTSLLADVQSGIEPYFTEKYWREDRTGGRWIEQRALRDGYATSAIVANDIPVEEHIAIQAAAQKWIDSSVSKTINAPNNQTPEETAKAYELAWKSGLKGLAYYRDGSRSVQVLYAEDPNETISRLKQEVEDLKGKLAFKERSQEYVHIDRIGPGNAKTIFKVPEGMTVLNFTGHNLDCQGQVVFEEGCEKCYTCMWTAC